MLKNPKKADLDKDGKLSGYEKKRAKAIESNMKQKPIKAALGIATMGLLGAKMLKDKKKKAAKLVSPVAMLEDVTKDEKNQVTTEQQKASKGKMMKAKTGKDVDIDLMEKITQQSLIGKGAMKTKVKKRSMGGKIMKAYEGAEAKGYGAARTQGQGLQDENLIPGKSLDYYKDIM